MPPHFQTYVTSRTGRRAYLAPLVHRAAFTLGNLIAISNKPFAQFTTTTFCASAISALGEIEIYRLLASYNQSQPGNPPVRPKTALTFVLHL